MNTVKYEPPPAVNKIRSDGLQLSSYNIRKLNTLVLEKSELTQSMVRRILDQFGMCDIRLTSDPVEAFHMIQDSPPDLIFSDWAPGLDGIAFLYRVRNESDSPNPFTPFVMVTAHTQLKNVCAARDAGMSEFLAKPFTPTLIYSRICMVIERQRMFVRNATYFGPNRRRRLAHFFGQERRSHAPLKAIDSRKRKAQPAWPESRAGYPGHNPQNSRRMRRA